MAWSEPRDWTAGEVVTAAIMNAHVRDNLEFLGGTDGTGGQVEAAAQQAATEGALLSMFFS